MIPVKKFEQDYLISGPEPWTIHMALAIALLPDAVTSPAILKPTTAVSFSRPCNKLIT